MVQEFLPVGVRLLLGLVIGYLIGLTGIGGGVLGLQAMTLVVGLDPITAVGTTSLYIFLTNISAVAHHARLRNIDYSIVWEMLAGAVPGVMLVSVWVARHSGDAAFETGLRRFIVVVVLLAVTVMAVNLAAVYRGALADGDGGISGFLKARPRLRAAAAVAAGCCVGSLVGATSVGGGVLVVPILVLVFGLTASRTVGSSVTITFVLTLVVSLIFGRSGVVDGRTAVTMAVGSLGGVPLGSRMAVRAPEFVLRAAMVVVIAVAALLMLTGTHNGAGR